MHSLKSLPPYDFSVMVLARPGPRINDCFHRVAQGQRCCLIQIELGDPPRTADNSFFFRLGTSLARDTFGREWRSGSFSRGRPLSGPNPLASCTDACAASSFRFCVPARRRSSAVLAPPPPRRGRLRTLPLGSATSGRGGGTGARPCPVALWGAMPLQTLSIPTPWPAQLPQGVFPQMYTLAQWSR